MLSIDILGLDLGKDDGKAIGLFVVPDSVSTSEKQSTNGFSYLFPRDNPNGFLYTDAIASRPSHRHLPPFPFTGRASPPLDRCSNHAGWTFALSSPSLCSAPLSIVNRLYTTDRRYATRTGSRQVSTSGLITASKSSHFTPSLLRSP